MCQGGGTGPDRGDAGEVKRLEDKKLGLELDGAALDWLAAVGYDPVYGARSLKRAIQRELETPIAKAILAGNLPGGWRKSGCRLLV